MKITIEHYDEKISVERKDDGMDFTEFMELIIRSARAIGYTDETIDKWFNREK